ncbi:MAG: recombination mediator RecR [Candidatus Alcyoniella australis]|nr:recombination mediator RecR [Candidatus Alcyoniella australis]
MDHPAPIRNLVREFSRLPGIGAKSATRLAYHLLSTSDEGAKRLADAIIELRQRIGLCEVCFQLTDVNPCATCSDQARDHSLICVVEQPPDVSAIERSSQYRGMYHVLHGSISPLDDVGPDELKIAELIKRASSPDVTEVILATNPTKEGEATAVYIADKLSSIDVRVTRIAHGIPVGGEVEYTDSATLGLALGGRREM